MIWEESNGRNLKNIMLQTIGLDRSFMKISNSYARIIYKNKLVCNKYQV
jgi:hypothetical protein